MKLKELLDSFIIDKELTGLSIESIKSYKTIISIFLRYVGSDLDYKLLDRPVVDNYIRYLLNNSKYSRNTVATYIRNTKIFLCWIYDNYDLSFNPHKIKLPKTPKKNVHIYNDNEIEYLFDKIQTYYPWITARNKAIVALMLDSGIRQGEVCTLKKSDFDFERMVFKVTGKGAKDRIVPLGNFTKKILFDYLEICPYKNSDYVFLDRLGNPISKNAIKVFMNKLKHDLNFDLSSHKLRHNFATNYCIDNLKNKGNTNVHDLSVIMGHESIETTKKYEHFAHELIAAENSTSHLDLAFGRKVVSRV